MFDVLIVGGGASGVSCAQILGSAFKKDFMSEKKIGIVMHQKGSMLQEAVFFNAYGVPLGTTGRELLQQSFESLNQYPELELIESEKVLSVNKIDSGFEVRTNKNTYHSHIVVIAVNSSGTFSIDGLMQYVEAHAKSKASKKQGAVGQCGSCSGSQSLCSRNISRSCKSAYYFSRKWSDGSYRYPDLFQ